MRIIITIYLILLSLNFSGQTLNDYSVYDQLLYDNYVKVPDTIWFQEHWYSSEYIGHKIKDVVIRDSTGVFEIPETAYLSCRSKLLNDETVENFIAVNASPAVLVDRFKVDLNIILIKQASLDSLFTSGKLYKRDGWIRFYIKYPITSGYITLSKVGYNKNRTQALVSFGNQSDWQAGYKVYIVYELGNSVWIEKERISVNLLR
jgi:hypothetical protein